MTPLRPALAAVLVASLACPAAAHEKQVHSDLIDTAYQIILAAEDPSLFAGATLPAGVTAKDAEALRVAMVGTPQRLARLPFDAGQPFAPCPTSGFQPNDWKTLGDADAGMSINYAVGAECERTGPALAAGALLETINVYKRLRFIGPALGYLAAHADDEFIDTTLQSRPTNAGLVVPGFIPVGPGPATHAANDALDFGLTVVFLPFVCVADWIIGNGNCVSHATDLADSANPIDQIAGAIPGIGPSTSDERVVGLWHHINVSGLSSNEYDDVQGYLIDEAGFGGVPDVLELGFIIAGDATGMSLDYDRSEGPKRYTVFSPDDGLPATKKRSRSDWQFHTVNHTAFEPLDNLAYYGWRQFLSGTHSAEALEWPLHAIGDAVSPMHTIGSAGWGHQPFERSIERDWPQVRFFRPNDVPSQRAQIRRVFTSALKYRKLVLDWRRTHPGTDVPVRELITTLARETYSGSLVTMVTSSWPYSALASSDYFLFDETHVYDRPDNAALVRPLIENGIGAAIAFLVSAAEVVP